MKIKKLFLYSALIIPLNSTDSWQILSFSRLKPNVTTFTSKGMNVKVESSSNPMIYPFKTPQSIKSVKIKGELMGSLNLTNLRQGEKGADDFALKLGFVLVGTKKLNVFQKVIAAKWIKTLYGLAPKNMGIDKILFLNAVQDKEILNTERQHPLSELIFEKSVWLLNNEGNFAFEYNFDNEIQVLAIWLSIDGDDTKSNTRY